MSNHPRSERVTQNRVIALFTDPAQADNLDAAGKIDWVVSIDSTIARVHQHGATLPRDTGGSTESQESAGRAA